ncbi:Limulus clotting factor C, partial [Dufourea novaeangliae]
LERFQCKDGECIPSVLLCDGRPDCKDQSDETYAECSKPEITCPSYAFRCAYGACVDGDSACNGVKNCVDNSDETLSRCNTSYNASTKCSTSQFKCNNGQCISASNVCDGTSNCTDNSDETFIQCGAIPCEQLFFRCRYGACIDGDLKCNGVTNCVDGSDEDPRLCKAPVTSTERPQPVTPPITPSWTLKPRIFCSVPPQPQNGFWKLHKSQCATGENCDTEHDVKFEPGAYLIYSCNPGYKIRGSSDVVCGLGGKWLNIPACVEIRCKNVNSASIRADCSYAGHNYISCESPKPGTVATLSCRNSYRRDTTFLSPTSVRCNENGQWDPEPMRCIPVCGVTPVNTKPLIVNGTQANIAEFPWHATLYRAERLDAPKEFTCGASIIHEKLLVTAAHCVYNDNTRSVDDPSKYYIATGNIYRDYDSPFHNNVIVKKARVKSIYVACSYTGLVGSYVADIAILEITEAFVFSSLLLPICLDFSNNMLLEAGMFGKVAGFGRTSTGPTSYILQTITLPYVSHRKCKEVSNALQTENFITIDKFCAGYTNGSSVCDGDSGGGLVFQREYLWYLKGIVSVSLGTQVVGGSRQCDSTTYSLYTAISTHISWIQNFLLALDIKRLLPTC